MALFDLARMTVSSSGTGTITLNAAVSGFLTFDLAGCSTASTGQAVTYAIADTAASEIGRGTYTSSALSLTRGSTSGANKLHSTNANSPINMSNAAQVIITPAANNMPAFLHYQSFTANGTYTPTTGMVYCIVECVGGGAGGAGAGTTTNQDEAGGGGGAGAYGKKFCTASDIGTSQTVTIGTAGAGGAAGAPGSSGHVTSLGALCTAGGGNFGFAGAGGHAAGGGGAAGTADVAIPGQSGFPGAFKTVSVSERFLSGAGGSTIFGAGGAGVAAFGIAINGNNAAGYGSGGSGGATQGSSALTATGGDGSAGFVLVTEFGSQ